MSLKCRVRFAPSPTGSLHLGGLRTALYNYLFAKKNNGKMVLRIEDTDQTRVIEKAAKNLHNILNWSGILFDEGPGDINRGSYGPYIQSERLYLYKEMIEYLLRIGAAYPCYCTKERLERLRGLQNAASGSLLFRYDRHCLGLSPAEKLSMAGKQHVMRLKMNNNIQSFEDIVFGKQIIPAHQLDDIILIKSDGWPTYHFANVVDDHFMKISHVIRGQEWIHSTPIHIALYNAFGWQTPMFAHLPLLINPDGSKLSKRQDKGLSPSQVEYYRNNNYFPESLINFVSRLGWTPKIHDVDNELLSIHQLASHFDLDKVHRSPAIVSLTKLEYFNREFLHKSISSSRPLPHIILDNLRKVLKDAFGSSKRPCWASNDSNIDDDEYLTSILELGKKQIQTLLDIPKFMGYLFTRPDYSSQDSKEFFKSFLMNPGIDSKTISQIITKLLEKISEEPLFTKENIESYFSSLKKSNDTLSHALIYSVIRYAITGSKIGVPMIPSMIFLGRQECIFRLKSCLDFIESYNIC